MEIKGLILFVVLLKHTSLFTSFIFIKMINYVCHDMLVTLEDNLWEMLLSFHMRIPGITLGRQVHKQTPSPGAVWLPCWETEGKKTLLSMDLIPFPPGSVFDY